jgi:transposase
MSESSDIDKELVSRLVTGHKRDGRSTYDAAAKAEIVRVCLQPGVSVARIAMRCGVNANLVRTWIGKRRRAGEVPAIARVGSVDAGVAFMPLRIEAAEEPVREQAATMRLHVRLPNGVEFDLGQARLDELTPVLRILSAMSCSGSTNR